MSSGAKSFLQLSFGIGLGLMTVVPGLADEQPQVAKTPVGDVAADNPMVIELKQRYKLTNLYLEESDGSTIQGLFTIAGALDSAEPLADRSAGEPPDPRGRALSFLEREAALFALTEVDRQLGLARILNDQHGNVHLIYHRYVHGLRLDGMELRLHFDRTLHHYAADGNAILLLPSDEVGIANRMAEGILDKDKLGDLALDDLMRNQGIPREALLVRELEVVATPDLPYVVGKADVVAATGNGRWSLTLDAVSGDVIERLDTLKRTKPFVSVPGIGPPPPRPRREPSPKLELGPDLSFEPGTATSIPPPDKSLRIAPSEGFLVEVGSGSFGDRSPDRTEAYASSSEAEAKRQLDESVEGLR